MRWSAAHVAYMECSTCRVYGVQHM